jgi:hypothetical protein
MWVAGGNFSNTRHAMFNSVAHGQSAGHIAMGSVALGPEAEVQDCEARFAFALKHLCLRCTRVLLAS